MCQCDTDALTPDHCMSEKNYIREGTGCMYGNGCMDKGDAICPLIEIVWGMKENIGTVH